VSFSLIASFLLAPAATGDLQSALREFRAAHGPSWRVDVDEGTGFAEFLFGGSAQMSFAPRGDSEWFVLAREALALTTPIHGIEAATLVEDGVVFLPLGLAGTTDKVTVAFRQVVGGVPVESGSVNVLFDTTGRLLSVQTRALPFVAELDVVPSIDAKQGAKLALEAFAGDVGVRGSIMQGPALRVAQARRDDMRVGVLAWRVDVQFAAPDTQPEGTTYFVDAHTGEIAARERSVHQFDVSGTVSTKATPGVNPDTAGNAPTVQPLGFARITSGAVSTTADAGGNFTLVGVNAPANVTVVYDGLFNNVDNSAGANYSATFNATAATGNSFVLNPTPTEHVTAQANTALHVNLLRDWVRAVNPLDNHADFIHNSNVNINSSCNAYFAGTSINFFIAAGGCVNTAYSSVIAHEDGHWLNVKYGTGNGGDGMGEGNADLFAMYLYDDPVVGRGFCGTGCNIRTGDNLRQFCGDCCPACYGEVHADGEVWMGAAWKVRRNLNTSMGNAAGDAAANAIFSGWMNAYNQGAIQSVIEAQWLTLDDDDGDLDTGTPHFGDIDSAFRQQGFPGVTLQPLYLNGVTDLPDTQDTAGPYTVDANVHANSTASITSVQLFWRRHDGTFVSLPMASVGGPTYRASIPGQAAPAKVYYYVQASDSAAHVARFPSTAPAVSSCFTVGPTTLLYRDTFEFDQGWTVVNTLPVSGAWVRGDPVGTQGAGTQYQPEFDDPNDPGEQCMFTGQGSIGGNASEADVDDGPTRLVSPPYDLAGKIPEIGYSYWLANPAADDELTVELSPDGSNWFLARVHLGTSNGWESDVIDISSYFTPTSSVRIRFSIADVPDNSLTEAAIDDVRITAIGAGLCTAPHVFCTAKVNSLLCVPTVSFSGNPSASSASPFTIGAGQVLSQKSGIFFYGYGAASNPYQGGYMCVQPPLRRTPTQNSGGSPSGADCTGTLVFDMNARIQSGVDPNLTVGATVAGQFFYRDPGDPFTTGLTSAVTFVVCP
jgi:hypothetical protein